MPDISLPECPASAVVGTPLEDRSATSVQSDGWNRRIPIRLTKKEAALFRYSLELIDSQHQLFEQHKNLEMNSHPNTHLIFTDFDRGVYDAEMMAAFRRAFEKAKSVTVSHKRLRMERFAISEIYSCHFCSGAGPL